MVEQTPVIHKPKVPNLHGIFIAVHLFSGELVAIFPLPVQELPFYIYDTGTPFQ